MTQRDVEITTPDGVCRASLHTPDGGGAHPAVVMYTDAGGVRDTFHAMAQRLAGAGYAVLLPDPYYRLGEIEPFDLATAFTDPEQRRRLGELVASVTKAGSTTDTAAFLDWLAGQPEVLDDGVGVTGYCMGGGLALNAAGRFPGRVVAAASFHGGRLATDAPDSPHLLAPSMRARVLVAAARDDGSFDEDQARRLGEALTAAHVEHRIEVYDALHGFAVPDLPTYDAAAVERHWTETDHLFGSTLPA